MRHPPPDPAPRHYAGSVTLIRRSARGPAAAPAATTPGEIEDCAVLAEGGDVLKFMGDGVLAVFPFAAYGEPATAAAAALKAARRALAAIDALDAEPGPLGEIAGWRPLRAGIALHAGEVFFGNVGAAERLDFTVIGPAVNEASRVETLCKALRRPILMTAPVARLVGEDTEPLGDHRLPGVAQSLAVVAPQ